MLDSDCRRTRSLRWSTSCELVSSCWSIIGFGLDQCYWRGSKLEGLSIKVPLPLFQSKINSDSRCAGAIDCKWFNYESKRCRLFQCRGNIWGRTTDSYAGPRSHLLRFPNWPSLGNWVTKFPILLLYSGPAYGSTAVQMGRIRNEKYPFTSQCYSNKGLVGSLYVIFIHPHF